MNMISPVLMLLATALLLVPCSVDAAPADLRVKTQATFARSGGVQGSRTLEQLPFSSPLGQTVGHFVFTPDGTAYWSSFPNEMESCTPSGELRRISVPHAGGNAGGTFLYARGDMWMFGDTGIVKVRPDGTQRRWYPFTSPGFVTNVQQMAYGPDGGIYVLALSYPKDGSATQNVLFRIGTNGIVTSTTLPVASLRPEAQSAIFGSDGLLYFAYVNASTSAVGIARVERNGAVTLFPMANFPSISSFVASRGSIYFVSATFKSSNITLDMLGRLTSAGAMSFVPFPGTTPNVFASYLTVDKGGNLWSTVASSTGNASLYQFNVYTGRFNGPYLSGSSILNGSPVVAPNDSVYVPYGQYFSVALGFDVFALSR